MDLERLRELAEELKQRASNQEKFIEDLPKSDSTRDDKIVCMKYLRQWATVIEESIK